MVQAELNTLLNQLRSGRLDRREFMRRAAALGLSIPLITALASVPGVSAQMAPGSKSITRDEYKKQLQEKYPLSQPQNKGGQMIMGNISDIHTVNGILASDDPTFYITNMIFESLVGASFVDGSVVPGLADSWELAADGVTYTFHLNQKATWHDGQPFTADDVKFSYDAELNPDTGSQYTSSVAQDLESYRVVDPHTFEMKSKGQIATFLYDTAGTVAIMPKHIWQNVPPKSWINDPGSTGKDPSRVIGTGPFKFKEWVQGDHATVVRNDAYYDDVPYLDELTLQVFPQEETALNALKVGQIDWYDVVPPALVADTQSAQGVKVDIYDNFSFNWYAYNLDPTKSPFFQDVRVRRALFMALDRQLIADKIYLGLARVAVGPQPVLSKSYDPSKITTHYNYDPNQAKTLLDQAGWTVGKNGIREKDGKPLSFSVYYTQNVATYSQLLPYMQQAWKAVGADAILKAIPFPSLQDRMEKSHDFDIVLLGFTWDVTGNQGPMFDTDSYNGGFNVMKYSNPEYDKLDTEQLHELDPQKRIQLQIQLANIENDDLPVGIFIFRKTPTAYNTRLQNYYANGYSYFGTINYVWAQK